MAPPAAPLALPFLLLACVAACALAAPTPTSGTYLVNVTDVQQTILGVGYEIQSDSIGSGNHGLPVTNTSVPWDLTPSERTRFYEEMLTGFRFCRLALGLYFRGLTPDQKHIVERWPGQVATLADMAKRSGIEGFEVEYWSPAPGWKNSQAYIDGTLSGYDAATLAEFGNAVVEDAQYLESNGLPVSWWGLQNEPAVGPEGCIYSCCGFDAAQYYLAFNATASRIRAAFSHTVIHASSWSGQHYSPQLTADPATLALVDAWTFHMVGANSDEQMSGQKSILAGAAGRPVLSNEYEYLSGNATAWRTINTAQSIMNWFVFENSPTWFWLHALKPLGHSEAATYGLGYWQPWVGTTGPPVIPPGTWEFNPYNWNSLAGFVKYLPWDSVRVGVVEDEVRLDHRVLAYMYDPEMARWLKPTGTQPRAKHSSKATLSDPSPSRAAATKLGVVLSNRNATLPFVYLVGFTTVSSGVFEGHLYSYNTTDAALGSVTASKGASGLLSITVTVPPLSLVFWVEQ